MTLIVKLVALIGFAIMFVWTLLTGREEVLITDRTQIVSVSDAEAAALGAQAFEEMVRRYPRVESGPDAARVERIAGRIAGAADELADPDYDWDVVLLEGEDVNAFALPGGKIGVFSGMLRVTRSDDQLAAVIGHEVAHVLARHGPERLTQEALAELGRMAVGVAIGDLDPATQAAVIGALGIGAQFGILMPFSRTHEAEADRIGLILMAAACYDPRAAAELWTTIAESGRAGPPEILSTHPNHGRRIEALGGWVDEALEAQDDADCPARGASS
jgi:predicted Zn-dependent protease